MFRHSFLAGLSAISLIALTAAAAAQSAGTPLPESVRAAASNQAPDSWRPATQSVSPYASAEALLKRFLAERESTLGKEHPFTLETLTSLASVYQAQGRYREAEPLYERALEASKRTLGQEHPFTQATARGLASAYKAEGRYAEAELLLGVEQSGSRMR